MKRAVKVLPVVTLGFVAVAALTGLALVWTYEPTSVWADTSLGHDVVSGVSSVHELSLRAAVPLALVTVVVLGVARQRARCVAMGVTCLAAIVASLAAVWPVRSASEHVDVDADDIPVFDLT